MPNALRAYFSRDGSCVERWSFPFMVQNTAPPCRRDTGVFLFASRGLDPLTYVLSLPPWSLGDRAEARPAQQARPRASRSARGGLRAKGPAAAGGVCHQGGVQAAGACRGSWSVYPRELGSHTRHKVGGNLFPQRLDEDVFMCARDIW